jgi:mono/diheme cytochrome c family protein
VLRVLVTLVFAGLVATAGATVFVYSGLYDIAATQQHTAPVFWVLKTTMRRAVGPHAREVVHVPPLDDPARIAHGRVLFQTHCMRCHGAPGLPPEPFALGLRPAPANLANTGIEWPPAHLYWTIKHGLKLTGMPAWQFRLREDELWALVAYVRKMPYETPRQFQDELRAFLAAQRASAPGEAAAVEVDVRESLGGIGAGDPDRGRHVILQYACISCHEIPGVVGASVPVGPPLDGMGVRSFIAGVLQNTPANMARWLREPQRFLPDGAMPNLGVREQDARDMAAYLETLR